jgi:hypothetical protein
MATPPRSFLLPSPLLMTPPRLAAPLLVLLEPGRREWRGVIHPELAQWITDLEALAGAAPAAAPVAEVRWMTVADAGPLLGLSPRQVTALAPKLGGRKVGKRWLLEQSAVLDEAAARSAAVSGRTEIDVA